MTFSSQERAPGDPTKPELRRKYCTLRECIPGQDLAAASAAVCARLAAFPPLREAGTVMTYLAFRNEVDLARLFEVLPVVQWVLPRIEGREIVVHAYDPTRLVRHRFGMLEPDWRLPVVSPQEIDIVLVPGVAYDRRGGRLGLGGGFYDRFLPTTPALRVGVSHSECLLDVLPCDHADARVHWVVTPTEMIRCDLG